MTKVQSKFPLRNIAIVSISDDSTKDKARQLLDALAKIIPWRRENDKDDLYRFEKNKQLLDRLVNKFNILNDIESYANNRRAIVSGHEFPRCEEFFHIIWESMYAADFVNDIANFIMRLTEDQNMCLEMEIDNNQEYLRIVPMKTLNSVE